MDVGKWFIKHRGFDEELKARLNIYAMDKAILLLGLKNSILSGEVKNLKFMIKFVIYFWKIFESDLEGICKEELGYYSWQTKGLEGY